MLLCGINAMAQENAASLPELQEWYSIKGGVSGLISYLPGFDSVGGGLNAITQHRNGKDIVWYNRFPFDTTSQFQWKSGGAYAVFQFDANGDGIPDYFDNKGRVYQGIKGQKPESEPAIILSRGGTLKPLIGDLNNDGYDDVLAYNDRDYFDVILGNKDISAMTRVTITYPMKESIYVGGYFSESGKPRIILFNDWGSFESFTIYAVTITYTGNQPSVTLEQLDIIRTFKGSSDEKIYSMFLTGFFNNQPLNQQFIISGYEREAKTTVIEIVNDVIKSNNVVNISIGTPQIIGGSIDADTIPDFVCLTDANIHINETRFVIYSGDETKRLLPRAVFPKNVCDIDAGIYYIGDVNKDGIGDIALGADGCFSIYLGLDWRTVNINSVAEYNSFKIHQNIPNPVQKDRKTLLPVSLKQGGNYAITLYSLQGSRIKDLFNGELSEGEHNIPLDLMGLSAGMYIVKMNSGSVSRERAIMIGE